jgi:hypothetical protein
MHGTTNLKQIISLLFCSTQWLHRIKLLRRTSQNENGYFYMNVNLDFAQALTYVHSVVTYLEDCTLSNAVDAVGSEAYSL